MSIWSLIGIAVILAFISLLIIIWLFYELIYELKDQIEELKQEINAIKLIQILTLKKNKEEKHLSEN